MLPVLRSGSSQSPSPSPLPSASATSSILNRTFPPADHAPPFSSTRDGPPTANDHLESNSSIRNLTSFPVESSNAAATIMAENLVKIETSDVVEEEEANINNNNSGNAAATKANGNSIIGIAVKEETVKSICADIIQTRDAYAATTEETLQSEIIFKRPRMINSQSKVNTYFRIGVLEDVRNALLSVGGQALLDRFVAGCFGHLIYFMPGKMCGKALHHVLSREIDMPGAENHEIWFHINGRNLCFSYAEYALITGLNFGSSAFSPAADHDLRNVEVYTRFCNGCQISVMDLMTRFSNKHAQIDDPDGDLYLRVAHVLVLYVFLLGYDSRKFVEPWVWKLVDDLEVFNRFPWGAYTYLTLRHYVKKLRRTKSPKYHFNGPVWAFYIWSLEVIPDLATAVATLVDMEARPRCKRWKFQNKLKPDLEPVFQREAAVHTQLVPNDDERNTFYWQSTQHPSALSVEFVEPCNPIKEGKPVRRHAPHAPTTEPISGVSRLMQEAPRTRRQQREAPTFDDSEFDPSMHDSPEMRQHGARTRDTGKRHRQSVLSSSSSDSEHHRQSHGNRACTRDMGKRQRKSISSSLRGDNETCTRFIDRCWMDEYTDMIVEKLEKRLMPQFMKMFEDMKDAVRCEVSGHSPPFASAPRCTPQSPIPMDVDRSREGHDVDSIQARDKES